MIIKDCLLLHNYWTSAETFWKRRNKSTFRIAVWNKWPAQGSNQNSTALWARNKNPSAKLSTTFPTQEWSASHNQSQSLSQSQRISTTHRRGSIIFLKASNHLLLRVIILSSKLTLSQSILVGRIRLRRVSFWRVRWRKVTRRMSCLGLSRLRKMRLVFITTTRERPVRWRNIRKFNKLLDCQSTPQASSTCQTTQNMKTNHKCLQSTQRLSRHQNSPTYR